MLRDAVRRCPANHPPERCSCRQKKRDYEEKVQRSLDRALARARLGWRRQEREDRDESP